MTEYVITGYEIQRQCWYEEVYVPEIEDCVERLVSHCIVTSPEIITEARSTDYGYLVA